MHLSLLSTSSLFGRNLFWPEGCLHKFVAKSEINGTDVYYVVAIFSCCHHIVRFAAEGRRSNHAKLYLFCSLPACIQYKLRTSLFPYAPSDACVSITTSTAALGN
jgi:hypothetical protein